MAPSRTYVNRRSRNAEDIEKAVAAVRSKELSIRKASMQFNIPFETLRRHASGEARSTTPGRPPKFGREMELELKDTVREMLNMGHSVGLDEVKELGMEFCASTGMEPFKKEIPSRGWARGFMARNNLTLKSPSDSPLPSIPTSNVKNIQTSSLDAQSVQVAVRSITNEDLPSKILLSHNEVLQTLGMRVHTHEDLQGRSNSSVDNDMKSQAFYVGHVVGLEADKEPAAELCHVEPEVAEQHGTKLSEVRIAAKNDEKSKEKPRRQFKKWNAMDIETALYGIKIQNLSIRQASKRFLIPFETLRRYVIEDAKSNSCGCPERQKLKNFVSVSQIINRNHGMKSEEAKVHGVPCELNSVEHFRKESQAIGWDVNFLSCNNLSLKSEDSTANSEELPIKTEIVDLKDT